MTAACNYFWSSDLLIMRQIQKTYLWKLKVATCSGAFFMKDKINVFEMLFLKICNVQSKKIFLHKGNSNVVFSKVDPQTEQDIFAGKK